MSCLVEYSLVTIYFINPRTRQSVNSTDFVNMGSSDPIFKRKNKIFNLYFCCLFIYQKKEKDMENAIIHRISIYIKKKKEFGI